ncbi:hypothetical protein H2O64_06425 [Kordia sp. YSTF-M3]|uniref:Secreted protein n=1 Tax=Kordia aestuariivivens TaxID=2759037 RepID=A0ABR7Q6W4_9FLAO|nr:hypothetical protein [Kordia aestuariivivens]MBC8754299.1 hypothetical protein [Kordia aestuariivivens]
MKKLIFTAAFVAAILFTGSLLFQVENIDAQTPTDPEPVDEVILGRWIKVYTGDSTHAYEMCVPCINGYDCDCVIGTIRRK